MNIIRKYGCLKDRREKLEHIYRPTFQAAVTFPDAFDLGAVPNAAFGLLDQGSLGSCTGFGCKRAAWYGLHKAGQVVEPSALFQYYNERLDDGDVDQDNGSTISEGIAALQKYGICPEADWPYDPAKFAVCPPLTPCYKDALQFKALTAERINNDGNLAQNIMDALFNQRIPIVFGTDVFQQFESEAAAQTGLIDLPAAGATPLGGHCMLIRGWDNNAPGGPRCRISNSWGQWGDNGDAWILFDYLAQYASDFWAIPVME